MLVKIQQSVGDASRTQARVQRIFDALMNHDHVRIKYAVKVNTFYFFLE